MTVYVEARHGIPIVHLDGALDLATAPAVRERVWDAVANGAAGLILDLTDLEHVDSAGVHLLFETIRRLQRRQQRLCLVIAPESLVADVVDAVHMAAFTEIDDDLEHAVERMSGPAPDPF